MKKYCRVLLGSKGKHAPACYEGGFIGVGYNMDLDFSGKFPENWKDFNKKYIPVFLKRHPGKSKIAAGLACGAIWMICYEIKIGDIILSPDGEGNYMLGTITSDYSYHSGESFPHHRSIEWKKDKILLQDMSDELKASLGSRWIYCFLSQHANEIERLFSGGSIISTEDKTIEDPSVFALEKHLEDFLVKNWEHTPLGKKYNIYEEDGELIGQQFPTDTGNIDILAISKNKKEILVIELKKGRASDVVVGQIQRYMGYVIDELMAKGQTVKGAIIAHEDDLRIRRALKVANNIDFYRYEVSFKLSKQKPKR
ncbi:endonuclease NucS domain-containing protein [Bacteroidota bacterium]